MSIWLSTAALAALTSTATATAPVETFEYTIKKGDSCAKISTEVYGSREHYEVIHQYNRWLGAQMPHHLEPGQTLTLPKKLPPKLPDAEVTAARRKVEARSADTSDWSSAAPGLDLYRGWRVNTHERSSAEITFRDDSRIEMRESTLVIIYGSSRSKARRKTTEAQLDRGSLRSRLGAYTGKSDRGVTVTTPSAVAEFEGGNSLVTVDEGGTSRVANHGKGKASVRSSGKRGRKVKVKSKMGSKVPKGKPPTKPKPLPPTPAWIDRGPTMFVAAADQGGTIYGEWGAIAGAKSYRVEISQQADGRETIANQTTTADKHRFEMQQLPPGDYYVSVAAIDDDAFESPPSETRKLSVVPVYLLTPGAAPLPETGEAGDPATPAGPTPVLRGTRLDVPRGLRCAVDDAEPSSEPVLSEPGEHTISCVTKDDKAVPGFRVSVVDVTVAPSAQASTAVRGETTTIEFSIDADVPLPRRVWIEAPEGFLVDSPTPSENGRWSVSVHADPGAASDAELRVKADAGGEEVDLGPLNLTVEDASRTSVPTTTHVGPRGPERHMIEAGAYGGMILPPSDHGLFQEAYVPADQYEPLRPVAGSLGLRLGYYPIRWVGLELENGIGPTRTRNTEERATMFMVRGHVLGQLPWRVTPTLHVGGGVLGVAATSVLGRDFNPTLHFGAGLKFFATRWAAVRLDVRDNVSSALEGGAAHAPEIILGVSGVIGRRSAAHARKGKKGNNKRNKKTKGERERKAPAASGSTSTSVGQTTP